MTPNDSTAKKKTDHPKKKKKRQIKFFGKY